MDLKVTRLTLHNGGPTLFRATRVLLRNIPKQANFAGIHGCETLEERHVEEAKGALADRSHR